MLRDDDSPRLAALAAGALARGELGIGDLTARRLGAFLGRTTSVLYHHFGSLDGFLYAVAGQGFRDLGAVLGEALAAGEVTDVAAAFVAFGLDRPALYHVMFERRHDWDALRRAGALEGQKPGLELWDHIVSALAAAGSPAPEGDARILYAGLHGLVSLAATGRANVGDLETSDREVALASARELARRLCPHARKENA